MSHKMEIIQTTSVSNGIAATFSFFMHRFYTFL